MFRSATFKLTGWYLLILMTISILFSAAIFQVTSREVTTRLGHLQETFINRTGIALMPDRLDAFRSGEVDQATSNLLIGLIYANVIILISGGIGSFLLAHRTLRPIQEAHEAQSRFTSDASHELRTPLATMKAELEVALREKKSNKADLEDVLRSNLEEVEKLSKLSEMLLSLSRLDHDKLERSALNLYDITKDVLRRYPQPKERIAIHSTKHSLIVGNEAAISELVSVLVDNALKYSPRNSLITITLSRRNHQACFEIVNVGDGITPNKLPHIFDRFYRADSSRSKHAEEGYGLGLALAKRIVELHSGELSVTSTPNQSTIFTVLLPLFQK